eukprot:c25241_g1_i1 orf=278-2605(+)
MEALHLLPSSKLGIMMLCSALGKHPLMPSLHFILFALTLIALPLCNGASTCPKCGNTTVPYPLSTSSSCGDQLYKVSCNMSDGKLSLNATSGSYPIINISPNSQRLVIASPSIAPKSCSTPDLDGGGLVLDPSLPFNVTGSNTILLLNCSQKLLLSPLNCSSNNLCSEYLGQESEGEPCVSKLCCTFTAGGSSTSHKIGIADGDCTAYVSVVGLNPSTPVNKWSYGIELQWQSPLEPICSSQADCDNLSTCQRDSGSNVSRCLCNKGYQWTGLSGTCTDDVLLCSQNGSQCGKQRREAPLIAGIVVGVLVCCVVALVFFVMQKRRRAVRQERAKLTMERQQILSEGGGGRSAKLFSSQEMKRATHNFAKERLLGSGGFGDVYKGILQDGTVVAVKSAKVGNMKGIEQVLNEVRILSQVNHRGLVMLLGCCVEAEQPLLVYEYIPNGTLLDHLKESRGTFLDWRTRLKVAVQTADGLAYLHSAANPPIYHRDVKSSNILLDAELNAKVSDFGLSRLAQADLSHISTCAQGTLGYLDPEYYRNYQLTAKSDVYSFGVVLLELVTSQRAIEFARGQDDVNLAIYVAGKAQEGRVMEVVDPRLLSRNAGTIPAGFSPSILAGLSPSTADFDSSSTGFDSTSTGNLGSSPAPLLQNRLPEPGSGRDSGRGGGNMTGEAAVAQSVYRVAYLALSCLQDSRSDRPSMKEVVEELQYSLQALDAALGLGGEVRGGGFPIADGNFPAGVGSISGAPVPVGDNASGSGFSSSASTISTSPHVFPR